MDKIRLADVLDVRDGTHDSPKYVLEGYPLITSKNVKDNEIDFNNVNYISLEDFEKINIRSKVDMGDIIMPMIGTIGNPVIVNTDKLFAIKNVALIKFNETNKLNNRYVYYTLKSPFVVNQLNTNKRGGTQAFVSLSNIRDIQIPMFELEKQKKIVEILDKAQELIDKRKEQIEACDELVKSRFIEMFGDPATNPMRWPEGTIRDIVSEVKYGTSKPAVEGGRYKYLRMNNITYNGSLDVSNLKYIDIPDKEIEKCIVRNGDVLFNRTNSKELVGKTCVFDLDEPMIIAGYIIRVRMNEKALPEFLSAILNSKYGKETLYGMCKAIVGQANINAQELQDIRVFIPPIELQIIYVQFIKQIYKLKFEMEQSLKQLEDNFNSLMQRAFKGEIF